jgi:hypothetical protein
MFVAGLVLAWTATSTELARSRLNAVVGLVAGAVAFLVSTAIGRGHVPESFGFFSARTDELQIIYVLAALVLAPLAVAATEIIRRWPAAAPVVCLLLLVGIPGNVDKLVDRTHDFAALQTEFKHSLLAIPRFDAVRQLPRSFRPSPVVAREVTLGWLLDGVASGRIPQSDRLPPREQATSTLRMVLQPDTRASASDCREVPLDEPLSVPKNGSIYARGRAITVVSIAADGVRSAPVSYNAPLRSGGRVALSTPIPLVLDLDVKAPAGSSGGAVDKRVFVCPPLERDTTRP